jgi:hypothetical protein
VGLATGAEHLRAELDGMLAAAARDRDPLFVAVAHFTTLDRPEPALALLCVIFCLFPGVFFFHGNVSCASQAADGRMIIRRSSAEVDVHLEFPLREFGPAVEVDGVVAEQVTVDPVPDFRREVEEAETTFALCPVEVSVSPV